MAGTKGMRRDRRRGRRGARRMRRGGAKRLAASEFASAKQTIDLPLDQVNQVYHLNDVNLSQFDRLLSLGRCYQYFRFTKIEMKFKPLADTFQQGNIASVPTFYYVINKSDTLDAGTFNQLRDAGAKAIRFDDKIVKLAWKPAVSNAVIGVQPVGGGPATQIAWSTYRTSPWLSTDDSPSDGSVAWNPSTVPHKGILYGVEQDVTAGALAIGVEITVHAQYKKPLTFLPVGMAYRAPVQKVVMEKAEVATNPPI